MDSPFGILQCTNLTLSPTTVPASPPRFSAVVVLAIIEENISQLPNHEIEALLENNHTTDPPLKILAKLFIPKMTFYSGDCSFQKQSGKPLINTRGLSFVSGLF